MTRGSQVARALKIQAEACTAFGSPFSGALMQSAGEDVEAGGPTAALMAPWADASARALMTDAVPVRLLGALHDCVLSGDAPTLAEAYPGEGRSGDTEAAWREARKLIEEIPDRLIEFMGHEPQTNEVRRSACLIGGFLTVAKETGLPLRCFEIGASAGLNQLWDRFRYVLGSQATWGAADASVLIPTDWHGLPPPVDADVQVVERAACDRKPVDLADPLARRRLRAFVWADQLDRIARLEAAIALAQVEGASVERSDAVAWASSRAPPADGAATILYHSVFWQYMPPESQAALRAVIKSHGGAASKSSPFAWVRMEPPPDDLANMELRLTLWPGGDERLLARVHPHGASVNWLGAVSN